LKKVREEEAVGPKETNTPVDDEAIEEEEQQQHEEEPEPVSD
jgi:hypothetical protein